MSDAEIRQIAIQAMFSDDELMDRLALKGGNALCLYGIGSRASIDLDFSMEDDFEDVDDVRERIFRLLKERLDSGGYVVFDRSFERRPPGSSPGDLWGGYDIEFKAISKQLFQELGGRLEKIRRQAVTVGDARQSRKFKIQISTHEYSQGRRELTVGYYTVYAYTPEMIALEKLRAICQQMPDYPHRTNATARARDFYDIHQILAAGEGIELHTPENLELCRRIFAAKEVPLRFLAAIGEQRDFHLVDWPAVVDTVGGELEPFDYYFDSVLEAVARLEALWVE